MRQSRSRAASPVRSLRTACGFISAAAGASAFCDSCVRKTENAFLKYGLNTLLIAKFIPGLNAVAAPLAGDAGIGVFRFLAVDALGVVIWSGAYIGVGYVFSSQLELALAYIERLGSGFVILAAGLIAAWILWKFIQRRRFLKQLE